VALIALALGLAFPLGGLAILAFAVFDTFLLRRSAEASLQNI